MPDPIKVTVDLVNCRFNDDSGMVKSQLHTVGKKGVKVNFFVPPPATCTIQFSDAHVFGKKAFPKFPNQDLNPNDNIFTVLADQDDDLGEVQTTVKIVQGCRGPRIGPTDIIVP